MKTPVDLLIEHTAQVVSPVDPGGPRIGKAMEQLRIVRDGALAIDRGRIVAVGRTSALRGRFRPKQRIDAKGLVATPGLVDPHTHVVFAGARYDEFEQRIQGASYEQIHRAGGGILLSVRQTRAATTACLIQESKARLARMLRNGTTTAEVKSGYALDLQGEIRMLKAIRRLGRKTPITLVPTFLGAHALPRKYRRRPSRFVDLVVGRMIPAVARRGLARFCDVFCEPGCFTPSQSRRILNAGRAHGLLPKIHADEFVRSGGTQVAVEVEAVSADHLGAIQRRDIRALAASRTIATLLPGTMYFLGKATYPPARALIDAGVAVALGTDFNPGSNPCGSLPMAMNQACVLLEMTPAEALTACTLNAAYACAVGRSAGSLDPQKAADVVLWDTDDYRQIVFEYGTNLVHTVIKGGRIVHRARS